VTEPYRFETQRLWPDPEKGPWYVITYWTEVEGELVPYGVTVLSDVRPAEPPGSMLTTRRKGRPDPQTGQRKDLGPKYPLQAQRLTGSSLRGLRLPELWDDTAANQAEFHEAWAGWEQGRQAELKARAGQWRTRPATGRPPKWTPEDWQEIAAVCDRNPKRPVQALVEWYWDKYGKEISEDGARKWRRQLRKVLAAERSDK